MTNMSSKFDDCHNFPDVNNANSNNVAMTQEELYNFMTIMKNFTPEQINSIHELQPQRNVPQIILILAIYLNNSETVEWVCNTYPEVLPQVIRPDTYDVLAYCGVYLNVNRGA